MSQFKTEKAVFIGVVLEKGGERKVQEYLDELQFLAETAGAIGDKMFMQRMDRPDKRNTARRTKSSTSSSTTNSPGRSSEISRRSSSVPTSSTGPA